MIQGRRGDDVEIRGDGIVVIAREARGRSCG